MCKPLISVIIPVYNTFEYLQRGIDSVLSQTYENIELIVINDGSTDGSEKLLDKINRDNPNVIVHHQSNSGVSAARNKGLSLVNGKFICFLDSDDWLPKDSIEFLHEQIKNRDNIISACDRCIVKAIDGENIINRKELKQPIQYLSAMDALLETGTGKFNLQSACYKLFPTKLINGCNKIRFREELSHGEDGLFVFDVLNYASGIVYSTEPKWYVLDRENSATNVGYSPKMVSALYAVDKMILMSKYKTELLNSLKIYYTRRAMGLVTVYSTSKYTDKKERKVLSVALKKYEKEFLRSDVAIVDKVKYYVMLYLPKCIINLLYRIKKIKNG